MPGFRPALSGMPVALSSLSARLTASAYITREGESKMLGTVLLVILVLALIGSIPVYPYSAGWGYYPSSILGTVVLVWLILVLIGRV
jgi:hypothetical protein